MSLNGFERAPIASVSDDYDSDRAEVSMAGFKRVTSHMYWLRRHFKVGGDDQFCVSREDLERYQMVISDAGVDSMVDGRRVDELGWHFASDAKGVINECRGRSVLDVGCGKGRFGKELRYSGAKAEITLVERDPDTLARVSPKIGAKVVADACTLPFNDNTFDRSFMTYSALTYPKSPVEAVQALGEIMRVTKPEGSSFLAPISIDLNIHDAMIKYGVVTPIEDYDDKTSEAYFNIRMLSEYLVINGLMRLIKSGYADVTWAHGKGVSEKISDGMEIITAIVDKKTDIPADVMSDLVDSAVIFNA
jgi:ubiquinone/menaquinone biosynthesis C-methylase UbiE